MLKSREGSLAISLSQHCPYLLSLHWSVLQCNCNGPSNNGAGLLKQSKIQAIWTSCRTVILKCWWCRDSKLYESSVWMVPGYQTIGADLSLVTVGLSLTVAKGFPLLENIIKKHCHMWDHYYFPSKSCERLYCYNRVIIKLTPEREPFQPHWLERSIYKKKEKHLSHDTCCVYLLHAALTLCSRQCCITPQWRTLGRMETESAMISC